MSRENVESVRTVHEGWARGDFAVGADLLAPDFEWHQFPQAVEPGTRRGRLDGPGGGGEQRYAAQGSASGAVRPELAGAVQ